MNTSAKSQQFHLPDVGEGLEEAEIVTWHVAVGDSIGNNQPLAEIETAKSLVELPSPYEGTVLEILAEPGQTVRVGEPVVSIGTATEEPAEPAPEVLVGYGPGTSAPARRRRRQTSQEQPPVARSVQPNAARAKPPVRRHAKQMGIDIETVTATGPYGTVTRQDLLRHADRATDHLPDPAPMAQAATRPDNEARRTPVTGVRKATAAAMTTSAFSAPHASEYHVVDVTRSVKLVGQLKTHPAFGQSKVSMLLPVARALLAAVSEHPAINASWADTEILEHPAVNLGIAAATPRGLLVPNIKNAQSLTLPSLARAITELVDTARKGRSSPQEMTGGTITITNIGIYGIDAGTPILNPGEAAILCLGAVRRLPWEHNGRIELRWVTRLTLSFDHRIVDGELASKALSRIGQILHRPKTELLLT
ncbi:dihydrolipoamide acetyltransferase family protein [Sciscionella marina]|uniref:dihydrolipoamide acetyltransferase family protein n=1 Tax=Sciscionella marina TaxID=508770 RepID=UPI00036F2BFA|nr:dihydrolipoamide acetyltransferase family protein [Sciscionella marina]